MGPFQNSPLQCTLHRRALQLTSQCHALKSHNKLSFFPRHSLRPQVLAESSFEGAFVKVRKTLQGVGAKKLQPPSTPRQNTLVALHHICKRSSVSGSMKVKCSPCSSCWTAGGTPGCSSCHTATTPQVSSALSEKALRLCAALSVVTSRIYPTSLLRLLQFCVWE